MITWQEVDELIQRAQQPLDDHWLEKLNIEQQPYYRFLYLLADKLHSPLALEIGVGRGVASAHLAAGLEPWDGQVAGFDINRVPLATSIIDRYGNFWPQQLDASSELAQLGAASLVDRYGSIGIVYQDAASHYQSSLDEWATYSPLCKNGLWLCNNITPAFHDPNVDLPGKGMVEYWDALPGPKRLYPEILHRGNTQGIIIL